MGKIYTNENQKLLTNLVEIYKPENFDWLSYQITRKNTLTLHHIVKLENGGPLSITNAALLTKRSHRALHMCESRDYILYSEINDFFREIIGSGSFNDSLTKESREYKKALVKALYK